MNRKFIILHSWVEIFDATCRFACCRFSLGSQRLASGSATTRGCKGSHELQMVKWNRYQIDCIKWTWWTFFIELREKSIIWNCQEVLVFTSKSDVFRVASNPMWNLKVATEDWKAFPWMTSCPRPPRVGIYGGAYEAVRQPISELRPWEANDIHHSAVGKRVGSLLSIPSPGTLFYFWRVIAAIRM